MHCFHHLLQLKTDVYFSMLPLVQNVLYFIENDRNDRNISWPCFKSLCYCWWIILIVIYNIITMFLPWSIFYNQVYLWHTFCLTLHWLNEPILLEVSFIPVLGEVFENHTWVEYWDKHSFFSRSFLIIWNQAKLMKGIERVLDFLKSIPWVVFCPTQPVTYRGILKKIFKENLVLYLKF